MTYVRLAACAALIACSASSLATAVEIASPLGEHVPANLLRIELRLDAPRDQPLDVRQIRLLRAGEEIDNAFLGLPLPSRDGRTVTLLLHPGRIKTGVGPHLALGLALRAGDQITLVIDDPSLSRTWRVTEPRRQRLAVSRWRIETPPADSRAALRITPDAELGSGAQGLVGVADELGHRVAGRGQLTADGAHWNFVPSAPWRAGRYTLRIHPALEDVAGNRPCAAFEQQGLSAVECRSESTRSFMVKRR
jgi:hypothetical protein